MDTVVQVLFSIIKNVIDETESDNIDFYNLTEEQQKKLFEIADKHSLAHLIAQGLGFEHADLEIVRDFLQVLCTELQKYEIVQRELTEICDMFEKLNVPYIPLKGSRLCKYYPEAWMRSRGDLDILVHRSDIHRSVTELCTYHGYEFDKDNYHDMSLIAPSGLTFELHFNIQENNKRLDKVLSRVWDYSYQNSGSCWQQSNEFFVFHQVAHMAYHFLGGGCGIRPFIDLYVLKNKFYYNESGVIELCKEAHIQTFYSYAKQLVGVWFEGKEHTNITRKMEEYVITGGVYGSMENSINMSRNKNTDNKSSSYIISRLFMPYNNLIILYPSLKGHKYLLPYYEVKRWCSLLNKNKLKRIKKELNINSKLTMSSIESVGDLLENLDLK